MGGIVSRMQKSQRSERDEHQDPYKEDLQKLADNNNLKMLVEHAMSMRRNNKLQHTNFIKQLMLNVAVRKEIITYEKANALATQRTPAVVTAIRKAQKAQTNGLMPQQLQF